MKTRIIYILITGLFFRFNSFSQIQQPEKPFSLEKDKKEAKKLFEENKQQIGISIDEEIKMLKSNDFMTRLHAAEQAFYFDNSEIYPVLDNMIENDTSMEIKIAIVKSLKDLQPEKAIPILIKSIKFKNNELQIQSALSLAFLAEKEVSINIFKNYFDTKERRIGLIINLGLREIANSEAIDLLEINLNHENDYISVDAAIMLAQLGYFDKSFELLKMFLNHEDKYIRGAAMQGLAYIGNDESLNLIKKNIDDPDPIVNRQAKRLLDSYHIDYDDSKKKLKSQISLTDYTHQAAVLYAEEWWDDRNPDYYDYGNSDCANFVSQCLIAGGLDLSAGANGSGSGVDPRGTIPSCNNLHLHLINYQDVEYERKGDPNEACWIDVADVAIFGGSSDYWQHAVFSVESEEYDIAPFCRTALYNAHSTNRWHKDVDWFYSATWPSCDFYHINAPESIELIGNFVVNIIIDLTNSQLKSTNFATNTVKFRDLSTGNPTSWYWDFGDGNYSTEQNPTHTYSDGIYTVSLTVFKYDLQNTLTKSDYIIINSNGQDFANFIIPDPVFINEATQFRDASIVFGDNWITDWEWKFYDYSGEYNSHLEDPLYIFTKTGNYEVRLKVTDKYNFVDYCYKTIKVIERGDPYCGNDILDPGEDCYNCSNDCPEQEGLIYCGNGICDKGENMINCMIDCWECNAKNTQYFSNTNDLPYATAARDRIVAGQYVTTPNGIVQINNGDVVHFYAGERMNFEEGFKVDEGGYLFANIEECPCKNIEFLWYPNVFIPNGDHVNDYYYIHVNGANRYEIEVKVQSNNTTIYLNSGNITNNLPVIWDGTINRNGFGLAPPGVYKYRIILYNDCLGTSQVFDIEDIYLFHDKSIETINDITYNDNYDIMIYPNPVKNILYIGCKLNKIEAIEIFNNFGQKIIHNNDYQNNEGINLLNLASGLYIIKINTKEDIIIRKIIKE
ncbi:MAG: amidase domain-containing protein [Bacteroidales bacterium]|nr:amidase domain-containing protein [Bacteroidales bacterium]